MNWIRQPGLWSKAMEKANESVPKWTKAFWRKTREIYESYGGNFEVTNDDPSAEDYGDPSLD